MITNFKIFKSKKEFILLVGPPGSGKSTFIKKLQKNNEYDVINRDDVVTEVAERNGITYKEMFSKPNQVFLKTGKIFNPDDSDFYVENGKKYLKDFEHFGEIVDVEPNEYLSKFSPTKFKKLYELNVEVENTIDKNLEYLIRKKHNIIIDMTNNNEYNRKQIIGKLKSNRQYYKVIAAVFNNGGQGMEDLLIKINRLRDIPLAKIGRDKAISDETIKRFVNSYEPPTKSEGIDKIIFVDTKTNLEKLVKESNSEYLCEKFFSKTLLDKLYDLLNKHFECKIKWNTAIEFPECYDELGLMKSFINIEKKGNYIKIIFYDLSNSGEFNFVRNYLLDNFKLFGGIKIIVKNNLGNGNYDEIKFKVEDYDEILKLISKFPSNDLMLFNKVKKYNL